MNIRTQEITAESWPDLGTLFGKTGACGGCWCMAWRLQPGEDWDALKGTTNKRRFGRLVREGRAHGILAYAGDEPVGWAAFDRRADFVRLQRARTLKCDDVEKVWSIPCFFVRRDLRGQGVAGQLLAHAVRAIRGHGGRIAEGYPAQPPKDGSALPGAFAWTGTPSLFARAGFRLVGNKGGSKERWRKTLR